MFVAVDAFAASKLGLVQGFIAISARIIAIAPLAIIASFIPGADQWKPLKSGPEPLLLGVALLFFAFAALKFARAVAARRAEDHDRARAHAFAGLAIASVPTSFILSVRWMVDAWPS